MGNKTDLGEKKEEVQFKEAQELALKYNAVLKFVSAKKNQGLNEVFQKLGEKLIIQPSNMISSGSRTGSIKLNINRHSSKSRRQTQARKGKCGC